MTEKDKADQGTVIDTTKTKTKVNSNVKYKQRHGYERHDPEKVTLPDEGQSAQAS